MVRNGSEHIANRVDPPWSPLTDPPFKDGRKQQGNNKETNNQAESKLHYLPKPREPKHGTRSNAGEQLVCFASVL